MRSLSTRVAAVALLACAACVADARGAGLPSAFHAGARVDVNARGQAIVAWDGSTGVRAVVGDRAGGFSATALLSTATDTFSSPQVAIDDAGDAIVVWETYRLSGGGQCSTCGPHLVSSGVWAALRRSGSAFGATVALAGPQRASGAEYQLAEPHLAMSSTGEAVLAWSDAAGAMAAFRPPGGEIRPPARAQPAGFAVHSAAIAGDGQAFLADGTGRVAVRPAGGTFGTPALLPGSASPYGPGALLAANAAGDVLAAYRGTRGAEVSRRSTGGGWSGPAVLTSVEGASERAVVLPDGGMGTVTFAQSSGDPWLGGRVSLLAATVRPDVPPGIEQVNGVGFDADMTVDAGLDMDGAGDAAVAFNRSDGLLAPGVAQLAYRPAAGPFATPGTLTPADVARHAEGDAADVAFGADGEMLVTWSDHYPKEDRITARWIGRAGIGSAITLDRAVAGDFAFPVVTGHAAQLTTQRHRRPDRHGRILVGLRCLSFDRQPCTGAVNLTAGPRKWPAGHKRFAIAPGADKRIRVTLSSRARRVLRRRGHITLTATVVTTASRGSFDATKGRIVVDA
jgi:hypothetical protein